jgi:hypothetical protein
MVMFSCFCPHPREEVEEGALTKLKLTAILEAGGNRVTWGKLLK